MVVWSGRGGLIVIVFFACMALEAYAFPEIGKDYFLVFSCFVSAIFSWFAGIAWNTKKQRLVTDDETGQKIVIGGTHTLFWISMQYWGIILTVLGLVILFQSSIWLAVIAAVMFCTVIVALKMKNKEKNKIEKNNLEQSTSIASKAAEDELIKRRAEKEDHSRFMPQ